MDAAKDTPMDAVQNRVRLDRITGAIIGSAQRVSTVMGHGFVERIYEAALVAELERRKLLVQRQPLVQVWYEELLVGECVLDLVVEKEVVVELKAVNRLLDTHRMQCLNYLKATGLSVCLLLNFGNPRLEYKRVVNHF